jgi:hypothetical protein
MEFEKVTPGVFTPPDPNEPDESNLKGNITRFTLGGRKYAVGELNLQSMRRCWPSISTLVGDSQAGMPVSPGDIVQEQLKRSRAACELIVCALGGNHQGGEADAFERSLGFNEMNDVIAAGLEILRACGFLRPLAPQGTQGPAAVNPSATPSGETSTG